MERDADSLECRLLEMTQQWTEASLSHVITKDSAKYLEAIYCNEIPYNQNCL